MVVIVPITLWRYSKINNYIIRRALATVTVPAVLEPSGMLRTDGKPGPGAVICIPWSMGRILAGTSHVWTHGFVPPSEPSKRADS